MTIESYGSITGHGGCASSSAPPPSAGAAIVPAVPRVVGFRVEPATLHWAVVEGLREAPILVDADEASAPLNYSEGGSLTWYRSRVLQLLETFHPDAGAIRSAEPISASKGDAPKRRCRIEGVILQALDSQRIPASTAALARISARLGMKSTKLLLDRDDLRGLDWGTKNKNTREAILVAASALESPS